MLNETRTPNRLSLFADYIPTKKFVDFGLDVLPGLVGRMYGYVIEEYLIDIGSPKNYERANEQWAGLS